MYLLRMFFMGIVCFSVTTSVLADGPYRTTTAGNGTIITTTGQTSGSGNGGGVNTDKCTQATLGKSCGQNKGIGVCKTVMGTPSCVMSSCKEPYYLEYGKAREVGSGEECTKGEIAGKMAEGWSSCVSQPKSICRKAEVVTGLCSTPSPKGWFNKKTQEGEPQDWVANVVKLESGTTVIAACKNIKRSSKTCKTDGENAQVLDKNLKKCVPCKPCESTNANCKLTGSDGDKFCYYETSCKDGYGNEQHSGSYNPSCSANEYTITYDLKGGSGGCSPASYVFGQGANINCNLTKSGKAFAGICPDLDQSGSCSQTYTISATEQGNKNFYVTWNDCSQAQLDEIGASAGEFGSDGQTCIPTECKSSTAIIKDGKCIECNPCNSKEGTNCELYVKNNECKYQISCKEGYGEPIDGDDTPDGACSKNAPNTFTISYDLQQGTGCDDAPKSYTVGTETVVSCNPTREGFSLNGWSLDGQPVDLPYKIPEEATGNKNFVVTGWTELEKPRTECTDEEKKKFPHAVEFNFENGKCLPIKCEDNYVLNTETNQCEKKECTEEEKKKFPHADAFKVENGECKPIHCEKGFKLQDDECVDDGIKEAEDKFKNAKDKETSFENRMLGGATMAATGIGGMQLAQGLAEKKADESAERDMAAYMATFQCKIGSKGSKTYTGGTKSIETPGANQLVGLYQEYVDLAADLKERKNALGMKPGIESEVILDKANTGLYDDVGTGNKNGTYASLYRAAMGNETDAAKLQEQKDESAKRVKTGGTLAVGGAVAGMVGNSLINGKLGKVVEGVVGNKTDSKNNKTTVDEIKKKVDGAGVTTATKSNGGTGGSAQTETTITNEDIQNESQCTEIGWYWVGKNNKCIPKNPCKSDVEDAIKQKYCFGWSLNFRDEHQRDIWIKKFATETFETTVKKILNLGSNGVDGMNGYTLQTVGFVTEDDNYYAIDIGYSNYVDILNLAALAHKVSSVQTTFIDTSSTLQIDLHPSRNETVCKSIIEFTKELAPDHHQILSFHSYHDGSYGCIAKVTEK